MTIHAKHKVQKANPEFKRGQWLPDVRVEALARHLAPAVLGAASQEPSEFDSVWATAPSPISPTAPDLTGEGRSAVGTFTSVNLDV